MATRRSSMLKITKVRCSPLNDSSYIVPFQLEYEQSGVAKQWHLIKIHNSVAIIIFNVRRNVLVCVKQFRPGVYVNSIPRKDIYEAIDLTKYPPELGITLEFCAGIVDKDKPLEVIAAEEVFEECGYLVDPSKLEKVKTFRASVGVSGELQTLFYVEVDDSMKSGKGGGIEDEVIEIVEIPIDEARELLQADCTSAPGEFLFALLWFFTYKCRLIPHKTSN